MKEENQTQRLFLVEHAKSYVKHVVPSSWFFRYLGLVSWILLSILPEAKIIDGQDFWIDQKGLCSCSEGGGVIRLETLIELKLLNSRC